MVVGALLGPFRCRCPGVLIPLRGVEAEASEQGHGPRAHLCSDGPVGVPLPTFTLMSVWGRFGAPGTPRAAGPPGGRPGLLHLLAGQVRWAGRLRSTSATFWWKQIRQWMNYLLPALHKSEA